MGPPISNVDDEPGFRLRVAFLILAHKDPAYIERLARLLGLDGDEVFVHIDKAVSVVDFESQLASINRYTHLIAERYAIDWGGFNMVRATNALLSAALTRGTFDYFCLLSGQCFPVRPLSWLKKVLANGFDHIDCQPMPQPTKPMSRLARRTVSVRGLRYRYKQTLEAALNLLPVGNFQRTFGMVPYAGAQWWYLRRETIEFINAFRRACPKYDRFMRWTHVPDEMYYHTIAATGLQKGRIAGPVTGAIWVDGRQHPEILTRANLPSQLQRDIFLARKFQADDEELLDELQNSACR